MKNALLVDIDNVITETDSVMRSIIKDVTNGRVCLEYREVEQFDYCLARSSNGFSVTKEEWHSVHARFATSQYLLSLQPLDGVVESLSILSECYAIHIATSRLRSGWGPTIEWLECHSIPVHGLHFVSHGQKHQHMHRFTAVVEDHYEQVVAFSEAGNIECYIMSHPWNSSKPKLDRVVWVENWKELTQRLLNR